MKNYFNSNILNILFLQSLNPEYELNWAKIRTLREKYVFHLILFGE